MAMTNDAIPAAAAMAATIAPTVPTFDHIVVVMEENHSYNQIIGDTLDAPYINNTLAAGGALMGNYFAITSPSEPNYFALYAGSTFGVTDDNFHSEPDPTLYTILQAAGKTFTGFVDTASNATDQNHNPWEYFPEGTSVETGFTSFPALFPSGDYSSLPNVSFVIPNVNDDMHNGTIAAGDSWLQTNLSAYALWATSHNSLLIVTWDESGGTQNNQVPAIFYGADVKPGVYTTTSYDHYNMLSTLLAGYGLTGPNNAATAAPISEIFTPPCYRRGTLILTESGEVPIENLAIGDMVMTLSGWLRPIRWIGRRAYDGRFIAGKRDVLPICITAGALSDGVPARDLWVSPGHSLSLDGVLVLAEHLVNGATIVHADSVDEIEYFHIELDMHDIVFADGAPAETFVDCDNRLMFVNGAGYAAHYPDDDRPTWKFCLPRLEWGSDELTTIRAALLERAAAHGHALDTDPDFQLIVDGEIIRPDSIVDCVYRFDIPAGSAAVSLASRSTVPAEVVGASRDIRRLGVPVERITLREAGMWIEIEHGHAGLCDGFHEDEEGHRWTNGLARLPETWLRPLSGAVILEVRLVSSELPYRLDPPARAARIAAGTGPARAVRRPRRAAARQT
jgi:Hint domain-containing protein/phosphoesterase family protein